METIINSTRTLRSTEILPISDSVVSVGTGSGHTHSNKIFLDAINTNSQKVMLYNNEPMAIPLLEETW